MTSRAFFTVLVSLCCAGCAVHPDDAVGLDALDETQLFLEALPSLHFDVDYRSQVVNHYALAGQIFVALEETVSETVAPAEVHVRYSVYDGSGTDEVVVPRLFDPNGEELASRPGSGGRDLSFQIEESGPHYLLASYTRSELLRAPTNWTLRLECDGCAPPAEPTDAEVGECLFSAFPCAMDRLRQHRSEVGDRRSRTALAGCLAEQEVPSSGRPCEGACDDDNESCRSIYTELREWADDLWGGPDGERDPEYCIGYSTASTHGPVESCLEHYRRYTIADREWAPGDVVRAWSRTFGGTNCRDFALSHVACGGSVLSDRAEHVEPLCTSLCSAVGDERDQCQAACVTDRCLDVVLNDCRDECERPEQGAEDSAGCYRACMGGACRAYCGDACGTATRL